jgi:hypothetical protein
VAVGAAAGCLWAGSAAQAQAVMWSVPTPLLGSVGQPVVYAVGLSSRGEAVAAWIDNSGSVFASVAPPGGGFNRPQRLARLGTGASLGPSRLLSVNARGDAIVVWAVQYGRRVGLYASYRPAGGVFGVPERIAGNGLGSDFGLDSRGNATFVWVSRRDGRGPRSVKVVERAAGGRLFAAQRLQTAIGSAASSVAVNQRGDAVIAWVNGSLTGGRAWCATRRAGHRFGRPVVLGPATGIADPSVGIDDRGRGLIAWYGPYKRARPFPSGAVRVATVQVGKLKLRSLQRLPARGSERLVEVGPSVRVDPGGDAIVAWDVYGKSPNAQGTIVVARATAGRRLNISTTQGTDQPRQPVGAAIGSGGEAIVAWNNNGRPNQALITSGANVPFDATQPISSPTRDSGRPAVALDSDGQAITLWWDLGPRRERGVGTGSTPLLYTMAKLR